MNTQFKKGVLEMCILGKMCRTDMYGYQIVHEISKNIEVTESTVYPILRRLTKEDCFESYLRESTEGPPRKYFTITETGKKRYCKLYEDWQDFVIAVDNTLSEVNVCE